MKMIVTAVVAAIWMTGAALAAHDHGSQRVPVWAGDVVGAVRDVVELHCDQMFTEQKPTALAKALEEVMNKYQSKEVIAHFSFEWDNREDRELTVLLHMPGNNATTVMQFVASGGEVTMIEARSKVATAKAVVLALGLSGCAIRPGTDQQGAY